MMTEIPSVVITSNEAGEPSQITIDVNQHPEAKAALKDVGLLPKSQFDVDFENGYTLDEV